MRKTRYRTQRHDLGVRGEVMLRYGMVSGVRHELQPRGIFRPEPNDHLTRGQLALLRGPWSSRGPWHAFRAGATWGRDLAVLPERLLNLRDGELCCQYRANHLDGLLTTCKDFATWEI